MVLGEDILTIILTHSYTTNNLSCLYTGTIWEEEMNYCSRCIVPDTRPGITLEDGVCNACRQVKIKDSIDWEARRLALVALLDIYRKYDEWDCVIPVSGGKNSCHQAMTMRDMGMHPLLYNFIPCELTDIGRNNLTYLREQGFDIIQSGMRLDAYKRISEYGFFNLGDCCYPEHLGIFTTPMIAKRFGIELIVYGENSAMEYGSAAQSAEASETKNPIKEQFDMCGSSLEKLVKEGVVDWDEVQMFQVPEEGKCIYLGYYIRHDNYEQYLKLKGTDWQERVTPQEGSYNTYENLDCKFVTIIHDYMKYRKFGFGRATDQLCDAIRNGRMSREMALDLVGMYEGRIPTEYVDDYCKFINISKDEFHQCLDKHTNKDLFKTNDGGLVKDDAGNVFKLARVQ